MASEIVVDAKPMEKLPYDPADIPEAVRKRAAAVDAMYGQANGSDGQQQQPSEPPESPPVPPEEASPPQASEPAPTATQPAPAEPAPPSPDDDGTDTPANWKRRYARMQGRYESSQKMIGEMQEQMTQLGRELYHVQNRAQAPQRQNSPPPPPPPQHYLTEQDEQNYGRELLDVAQRSAMQALSPELQEIRQQNLELQRRLAEEARHRMDQQLEMAVPDYREIDRDPRWHRWLLGIDLLSGRVRQTLLNEAKQSASAPRVISFFNSFKNEAIATGHSEPASYSPQAAPPREPAIQLSSLASPGRARPATGGDVSVPPERPVYTRAQIRDLYSAHRRGAYVGREAEWARQDADIIAAGREGRIR